MAEFPVLQMLYRQGMILPNHPNNTGEKPILIGSKSQIRSQLNYIHRGNYGLLNVKEMLSNWTTLKRAKELFRMKLAFAFGKINEPENFIDTIVLENYDEQEIKNGVTITRKSLNVFKIRYKNEEIIISLNLPKGKDYPPPYNLGYYDIKREYFGIIHSGQGDGWDTERPTMSSIVMFQGRIYLIDTGPNFLHILTSLGIGIDEVEGVFHTHAHDDHFCGITSLLRSDKKIKYFATPLVLGSVKKKFSALLDIDENDFENYFDVHVLLEEKWNYIEGLEVKPVMSPHPVETTIFTFRTMWGGGYKTYAHFADIVSFDVLEKMIEEDGKKPGVSKKLFDKTKREYLASYDLKKIDIGGGMIHGKSEDFRNDKSKKIILAHTAKELTNREKETGSNAPFGTVDVLIPVVQDYYWRFSYRYLASYFPEVLPHQIHILLNCDIVTFIPGTIIAKEGEMVDFIYLLLSGTTEMIQSEENIYVKLSAGALICDYSSLLHIPITETYTTLNYVKALKIPISLYQQFIKTNKLFDNAKRLIEKRRFIGRTELLGEDISYPIQNKIISSIKIETFKKGYCLKKEETKDVLRIIVEGELERYYKDKHIQTLTRGDYFGGLSRALKRESIFDFQVKKRLKTYKIPFDALEDIPIIRWKMFEKNEILKQKVNF
jgi:hemerythrin